MDFLEVQPTMRLMILLAIFWGIISVVMNADGAAMAFSVIPSLEI